MVEKTMPLTHAGIDWKTIAAITPIVIAIISAAIWISNKIFKFGRTSQKIDTLEKSLDEDVKPSLAKMSDRIDDILKSLALKQVSKSESPRTLNDFGEKVLKDSGVHSIIEPKLNDIVEQVKARNPENPYQVQEMLIDIIQDLRSDPAIKNDIEQAAFRSDIAVGTVLLVGAIDIRDVVLANLDMKPEEIDKHKPASPSSS